MSFIVYKLNGFTIYSDGSCESEAGFSGSIEVPDGETLTVTGDLNVTEDGQVSFTTQTVIADMLPTSDPSESGQWWNDGGVLSVSA
jgi:hypothetical protein